MRRSTSLAILVFIVVCLGAAIYLSGPSFQTAPPSTQETIQPKAENQPEQQSSTSSEILPEISKQNSSFCLGGCPKGMPDKNTIVIHHVLELSNNPKTKFADWVAYKISQDTLGEGCKRIWQTDPDLDPESTLHPSDYKGIRATLHSDRGHQAPLASLCGSPDWQEADYLSNITPQKTDLNEGTWERLEDRERGLISDGFVDAAYSLTGPLYEKAMDPLPNAHEHHEVPSGYWKIITVQKNGGIEAVAFLMDQYTRRGDDYCSKIVSIDEIERRTNLRFFPNISENIKALIRHKGNVPDLVAALGCD